MWCTLAKPNCGTHPQRIHDSEEPSPHRDSPPQNLSQSKCLPEQANLRQHPLDLVPVIEHWVGYSTIEPTLADEHYILNTTPMNILVNHPYRFSFKNTHLLAKHTNNEQDIRFAANGRRDTLPLGTPTARLDLLKNTNFKPPQGLTTIELWLNQPWELFPQPTESLRGILNSAAIDLLKQADRSEDMGLNIALAEDDKYRTPTLDQYISYQDDQPTRRPLIQWELVSPTLPIVRVTTYAEQKIPYLPEGTYLHTDDGEQTRDNHLFQIPVTRYAVSFVVAFQQRWDRFNQDERLQNYLPVDIEYDFTTDTVNRWYATDMMHHSIIGPVIVEVYESPVLEPGVYQKTPDKTTWSAPGFTGLAENNKHYAKRGGPYSLPWKHGPPTDQMTYIDSSNDWYLALAYGEPGATRKGNSTFNQPFPGHIGAMLYGRSTSNPRPCNFSAIDWAYSDEDCFEVTVIRNNYAIGKTYEYFDELGINLQP